MVSDRSQFFAHLSEDGTRTQTVYEHLSGTAKLAGEFASCFGAREEAEFCAWLHDIGKYTAGFQRRLRGGPPVDHSTAGAQEAWKRQHPHAAFAIAGHHSGIPDGGTRLDSPDDPTLFGRSKKKLPTYDPWAEITLPQSRVPSWANHDTLSSVFFTRMLYSCLVDADFIDTETFMNGCSVPRGEGDSIPTLLARMRAQAERYLGSTAVSPVSQKRNEVLRACLSHGQNWEQGLYTLTVPTGGGKTFASLAFALEHAAAHHLDRIIYVIPYTSIIDQTVDVFSRLLGEENVLAHFASADYKLVEKEDLTPAQYRQLLASENWDAPVIVTTAVQFFESLYANRSSRCRKLHNIANSIVIFDEAQALPNDYLLPCISAIDQLVQHYHTTAVLCTATQPALGALFQKICSPLISKEISPAPEQLYEVLRRVTLQDLGTLEQSVLEERLSSHEQVLCVVNRRKTAQSLFAALPPEGSYCLTTLLCPTDRQRQLAEIRSRLSAGLPCRVISTSLIEAGVDVDFPAAYREYIGLDSLLQTAGRCNREGRRRMEESIVSYFQLDGSPTPQMLRANVSALNAVVRHFPQPDTSKAIQRYFHELYGIRNNFDKKGILDAFQKGRNGCALPFAQVAESFHLIENSTRTVYIPVGDGAKLCEKLRNGFYGRSLLRQLGKYSVECYPDQFDALNAAGALELLENGAAILTDTSKYSPSTGLTMDIETGIGLFF